MMKLRGQPIGVTRSGRRIYSDAKGAEGFNFSELQLAAMHLHNHETALLSGLVAHATERPRLLRQTRRALDKVRALMRYATSPLRHGPPPTVGPSEVTLYPLAWVHLDARLAQDLYGGIEMAQREGLQAWLGFIRPDFDATKAASEPLPMYHVVFDAAHKFGRIICQGPDSQGEVVRMKAESPAHIVWRYAAQDY